MSPSDFFYRNREIAGFSNPSRAIYAAVRELLENSLDMIREVPEITVDLADVERSDSAGVALLVQWMREVRSQGKSITYLNIPSQMLAIARVSSLDTVLPLFRD